MMTPTACIQFGYEFLLENGTKEFKQGHTCYGAFDASQQLEKHGINLSNSTILNAIKSRSYQIDRLPYYEDVTRPLHVVAHFNRIGKRLDIVDVHLVFQRIG